MRLTVPYDTNRRLYRSLAPNVSNHWVECIAAGKGKGKWKCFLKYTNCTARHGTARTRLSFRLVFHGAEMSIRDYSGVTFISLSFSLFSFGRGRNRIESNRVRTRDQEERGSQNAYGGQIFDLVRVEDELLERTRRAVRLVRHRHEARVPALDDLHVPLAALENRQALEHCVLGFGCTLTNESYERLNGRSEWRRLRCTPAGTR